MGTDLSVVVPTRNRARSLDRLLASLAGQRGAPPEEVVVVDDGSTDDTPAVLAAWAERELGLAARRVAHRGPAGARNEGLRMASGRLVLFLDDDEVADPGLLEAHRAAHAEHPAPHQAVLGLVDWAPEIRRTRFIRWLDRSALQFPYEYLRPGRAEPAHATFVTANLSVKRAFLEGTGARFDERFPYPAFEDSELGWRLGALGLEVYYHPEALALHARQFRLRGFAGRMRRVGESSHLLRAASPDYPLDEGHFLRGPAGWRAVALRAASPVLRAVGPDRFATRYYDDVVTRAYRRGARRGDGPSGGAGR